MRQACLSGLDLCAHVAGSPTWPRASAAGQSWINETVWSLWVCFSASQFMYVKKFVAQHICLALLFSSLQQKKVCKSWTLYQAFISNYWQTLPKQANHHLIVKQFRKVYMCILYIAPGFYTMAVINHNEYYHEAKKKSTFSDALTWGIRHVF